jgi:hypothetical protein
MESFLTLYHQLERKLINIKQVVVEKTEENRTLKTNLGTA